MDCYKVLQLLTKFDKANPNVVTDQQLEEILETVYSSIPEDVLKEIAEDKSVISEVNDTSWQYLHLILYTIKTLCRTELAQESPLFTVDQFKSIKTAIEVSACIGIIPSLLPQVKTHANSIRSRTFKLKLDDDNITEKYKRISYTTSTLLDCYNEVILQAPILSQLDCLLAALLQLSHAPLSRPTEGNSTGSDSSSGFVMTNELYIKLKEEQTSFLLKLRKLIENCPQTLLIKELMVILGIKNNPKWLQISIKRYLTDRIVQDNGVATLILAICDEISDLGKCWEKLDVAARLVVMSHGSNEEEYFKSICSQIINLLNSRDNRQGAIIAKCCIKALYDHKQDIFMEKIFRKIAEPFYLESSNQPNASGILRTEDEVSQCVENLSKLFLTTDAEFKCIPNEVLVDVTLPLFYLYVVSHQSIYALRENVRKLILKILELESVRENTFAIILNHKESDQQKKLHFQFGSKGGLQITSESSYIGYEQIADCLFDLVKDKQQSFDLFTYLLKVLPQLNDTAQKAQEGKFLEIDEDGQNNLEIIEKQVIAVKLLTLLSDTSLVQKAQVKYPDPLLDFIKFLFRQLNSNNHTTHCELDVSMLYMGLMLVKIILTDGNAGQTWETYQNFIKSIKEQVDFKRMPQQVVSLVEEIETIIKKKGSAYASYCDLSVENKNMSEFEKAIVNLTDPLLPVRAHGIIALTKLIERRHPDAAMKKDFLLCVFQENLSHDDSFIYLAAINGICAMSSMFPDKVIEILVHEFVGMTQQTGNRDVAPETRAKLGEILVKTTRALGEMTPKYKTLLVNGFLCGTRDPDPLVRTSSLSGLGEICKIMGFRLGNLIIEILYCIECIIKTDKDDGCRRAGVLVATLLLRGLGKDALTELGQNLVPLYRAMKHLRDNDKDPVLQLHAQLALEEFNDIVQQFLFSPLKIEKKICLLP